MSSPFIIIRIVFISLLVYLNSLVLVFAAWNIGATNSVGISVHGAAIFLIFNACAIFLFVIVALAPLVVPKASTAFVGFECGWTGVLSVLQLGASISATISGPPVLCIPGAPFSVCASATVLVPISWLAAILMFGYFVMIFGAAIAHLSLHPFIWTCSFYSIPWFVDREVTQSSAPQLPPLLLHDPIRHSIVQGTSTSQGLPPRDIEKNLQPPPLLKVRSLASIVGANSPLTSIFHRTRPTASNLSLSPVITQNTGEGEKVPAWYARQKPFRPGRDLPFTIDTVSPSAYLPEASTSVSKGKERDPTEGSGFVKMTKEEKPFQGSSIYPEKETRLLYPYPRPVPAPSDPDKPIDMGRMSQWVKADVARGITLSEMPRPQSWERELYKK